MIFAFGFGSPLLLWGLALGGLPILIHLLHRRRYRETTWAAMRFLQQAIRSSSRRIRLEHLLLLIVRTLIVLLVVLALARPYAESFARFFGTEQPAHHIIVIDDSLSMSYRHEGETRFDRAREMARRIVSSAPQGHAFNLIRLTGTGPRSVISRPSWQKNEVLREIDRLEQAWGQAEMAPTLEEISRAVQQLPEMRRRQIYLISDLQRSTWWPDEAARREELRSRLARLAEGSTLSVLDTGTALSPNLAVQELSVDQQLISVGQPVLIRTVITSSGPTAPASGTVELVAGGRVTQSRTISFDAERETVAEFTHTFTEGGEQVLEVRLPEDLLPADNTRRIVLPVHDRFRVLLVNGVPAGLPQRQATWYLSNALQSENEPGATGSRLELQTVPDAELSRTSLNQYDCVLLSNVAVLTSRETDMLRAFAEAGGGIGIFPGNRILTQRWNETVFQPENPLIPVRFDGRVGNARNPSTTWAFDTNDLSHPIVAPFQESPGTGLESTLIWEYLKIVPLPDAAVATVLPLSSGDPAIVEAEVGEGRIILFATSADDQWSTWTTLGGGAFVPMVRETVQRLLTGRGGTRQLTVGQPLLHALATPPPGLSVSATDPAGIAVPVQLTPSAESVRIATEATRQPGVYELRLGAPLSVSLPFAVNADPLESQLSRLTRQELETELLPATGFRYSTRWQESPMEASEAETGRAGLARWMLLLAFGLLCVEQVMAWRFAWGVFALAMLAGSCLAANSFAWHPAAGWVAVAVTFAVGGLLLRRNLQGGNHADTAPARPLV